MNKLLRCAPNALSFFRLLVAPVVAFLVLEAQFSAALGIFLLAGLSDALDGYLARLYALSSRFGACLDPVADKLLMFAGYASLAYVALIPGWLAAVVVGRDFLILGGLAFAQVRRMPVAVRPLIVGKISTLTQLGFVVLVLVVQMFDGSWPALVQIGAGVVLLFTLWSLAAYAGVWGRAFAAGRTGVG